MTYCLPTSFDEAKLANYLQDYLPGANQGIKVKQFQGGQSNPTFLLDIAGKRYVLRKKPPGKLLPSAHMVEREFQVINALGKTDVPYRPHACCVKTPRSSAPRSTSWIMSKAASIRSRYWPRSHRKSACRSISP
ncbi:phosphotransferase [Halopseudomonas pachastrellae]|nr:phosphotransferase [Halopseudomonas pachastrellae]